MGFGTGSSLPPLDYIPSEKFKIVSDMKFGDFFFPFSDNVISESIRVNGVWEPEEVTWLEANIKPGMVCLNVGAHVGYFSKILGQLVGFDGRVVCVEPNNYLVPFLQKNLWGLDCEVEIYPAAAGETPGIGTLFIDNFNTGDNRMFHSNLNRFETSPNKGSVQIATRIFPGDQINFQNLDFILIDAQGWDHFVLRGLRKTIFEFQPVILCEFAPYWIAEAELDPLQTLGEITSSGYQIKSINGIRLNPQEVMAMMSPKNWCINLILRPLTK